VLTTGCSCSVNFSPADSMSFAIVPSIITQRQSFVFIIIRASLRSLHMAYRICTSGMVLTKILYSISPRQPSFEHARSEIKQFTRLLYSLLSNAVSLNQAYARLVRPELGLLLLHTLLWDNFDVELLPKRSLVVRLEQQQPVLR